MNSTNRLSLRPVLAALLLGGLFASPAWAAAKSESSEMASRHQQERSACMAKTDSYDRTVCLQDASAAYAEDKRRGLRKVPDADYQANQRRRCEALPGNYRQDCIARMKGAGTAIGTVESGGIYRELVTIEVGEVPAPKLSSPSMQSPEPAIKN